MATQPSTAVATIPTEEGERFNLMQREARLFSASPLIPQHLRQGGPEQAMANCYIALKMARTMGEDPLVVLQNIHVVNGKAGFAAQYMIARANSSGVFKGRINWRVDRGDPNNLKVTAFATLADTDELVEFMVDMAMAQAEGWTKNAKYRTMPEVMLRYRSAAFLVRFYAPDVMLGYHTAEEVDDVLAAGMPSAEPLTATMLTNQAKPAEETVAETVEETEPEPVEEAVIEEPAADEAEEAEQTPADAEEAAAESAETTTPAPEPELDNAEADWRAKADEILAGIRNAKRASYLDAIEEDYREVCVQMPKALCDEIEAALSAKRRELQSGEGGK